MIGAPALPDGYSIRRPTLEDADEIADLMNAVFVREIGAPDTDADEVRRDWAPSTHDLEADDWVIEGATGSIVGAIGVFHRRVERCQVDGFVHPDHEGLGLGTILVKLGEQRAREVAAEAPEGVRCVLHHGIWAKAEAGRAVLEAAGFTVERYFYRMKVEFDAPLAEPVVADGVRLDTMRPGDERPVWAGANEAFLDHWQSHQDSFEDWEKGHITEDISFDPSLWTLAWEGEDLVGGSLGRGATEGHPGEGYVMDVFVRRPWRGRGIGLATLLGTLRAFREAGLVAATLHVDAQNPTGALRLYEKAGMSVDEEIAIYEKILRDGAPPADLD